MDAPIIFGWEIDEKVDPARSVRQGDLVCFAGERDPLRKFGLVVTADCDLEHRKHGRLVTLIPLLSVKDVLERYLLIEECDKRRDHIFSSICARVSQKGDLRDQVFLEKVRAAITSLDDGDANLCVLGLDLVLHGVQLIRIEQYRALMNFSGIPLTKDVDKLHSKIQSKGDLIVLPSLRAMGIEADIAWVRNVWQVPVNKIVFKTSDVAAGIGQVIGRLASPFRYRVTQLMAQVFSDIGLPDYEMDVKQKIKGHFEND